MRNWKIGDKIKLVSYKEASRLYANSFFHPFTSNAYTIFGITWKNFYILCSGQGIIKDYVKPMEVSHINNIGHIYNVIFDDPIILAKLHRECSTYYYIPEILIDGKKHIFSLSDNLFIL